MFISCEGNQTSIVQPSNCIDEECCESGFSEGLQQECLPTEFLFYVTTLSAGYIFENIEISFSGGNVAIESSNCQEYNDCDWIGAFNDDVCVGATQWNTDDCLNGICSISVMGNDFQNTTPDGYMEAGEYPTFKIYDVSENMYYDTVDLGANYPWGYQAIHAIPLLLGQP